MVRTVTQKYQIWLAGYYDDFNGARAIPDYRNTPSSTSTYTHLASHHGNPLNGEAFLNPRYRWSVEERAIDSNKVAGNASRVSGTSPVNNFLMNDGLFEWLTFDDTRLGKDDYEGRIHLQYPDGHVANRYKFNNDSNYGSDFYQRFINGHNSDASYIVPVGDNDASFGRSDMKRYTEANYEDKNGGITSTTGNFVQRAHLTGVWMGEQLEQADIADTTPSQLFAELKSPSGKPFLCVQTVRKNIDSDSATGGQTTTPAIIYDGPLNTRLDGDIFTARIAVRGFMASNTIAIWDDMKVRFRVGFPISEAGILNDEGYTGTAAIDYTLDLADISYDTQGLLFSGSSAQSYTNDNSWIDVDFKFNYTANTFNVYVNGSSHATNVAMTDAAKDGTSDSATTASNLYGYQINIDSDETDGTYGYVSYLMLDRAGLVRYLTDDFTSSDEALVDKLSVKQSNNGISTCSVKLHDDPALTGGALGNAATDYLLNLRGLFVSSAPIDWNLLVFADTDNRIDRPVWRGTIDTFSITQKARGRELDITANDSLESLNNQIPLWDVGQKSQNETGDDTTYWSYSAQGFRDAMYLGAGKLKLLNNDVGFDSDSTFLETSTQRTQLGSGHPIQMYNNENTNTGPNNIEDFYEGVGIRSIQENAHASNNNIEIRLTSALHGLTGGETVSIQNSNNHDDTSVTVVTASSSSATITVSGLTYTPESVDNLILYAGARGIHEGAADFVNDDGTVHDGGETTEGLCTTEWENFRDTYPSSDYYTNEIDGPHYLKFIFKSNPNLKIGDLFAMNRRTKNHDVPTYKVNIFNQIHRVRRIVKFRNYFTESDLTENSVLYLVETDTQGGETTNTHYGDLTSGTGLLSGNDRYEWTKEQGLLSGTFITGSNHLRAKHRVLHARWMRDLPQSLWFKYHFGLVERDSKNFSASNYVTSGQTIDSTDKVIELSQTAYNNAPTSGVAEIWTAPNLTTGTAETFVGKFLYQGKVNVSSNYYLIGCKYIDFTFSTTTNSHVIKYQDISSDYKHIWLLWSDMRNNGLANADGSTRKKNFGLQYPLSENYDFDLFYIDQVDADGNIDKFASLKTGEDLDVWNLDSTADPCTGGPFSKPVDYENPESCTIELANTADLRVSDVAHGLSVGDYIYIFNSTAHDGHYQITAKTNDTFDIGSSWTTGGTADTGNTGGIFYAPVTGSHKDLAKYQDWEDKAGSFLVIDSSPFFNLNTHTNGARTGRNAGGFTDLSDYVATQHGFPALIDNYWAEATPSYQTVDEGFREHPNQDKLISDAQISPEGLIQYDCGITVDDATKYDDAGMGIIKVVYDRNSSENDTTQYFFSWKSKLETLYTKTGNNSGRADVSGGWEGIDAIVLSHASGTHEASGVKPGMILKRTDGTSGAVTRHTVLRLGDATNVGDTSGANTDTTIIVSKRNGDMVSGTTVTWAANDTYEIPVQLGHIQIISDTYSDDATFRTSTLEEREELIQSDIAASYDGGWATTGNRNLTFTTDTTLETTPDRFEVHATITSSFMLRLMMHIDGYYEAKNSGTYFNSDKFRFLWNAAITDSWLPSARLPCIFDINNVPVTSLMTTYNDTSSNDSYGSVLDSRGKSLGSIIKDLGKKSGYGTTNSIKTSFSGLVGRDNRIEFRPKYNSGVSLTRNNSMISKISAQVSGQVTNVRVYYNDNQSFVDFPATNLTDTTRWKILEHPKIKSSREALIVAQQQYSTYSNTSLKMNVSPIMESGAENKMIETGRYGYIADPYIALRGTNDNVANCTNWTYLGTGGALFPGMVNGLHGNMSTNDASARNDDSVSRFGISQDTGTGDVSWETNYYWYGSNSISNAVQIVHIPNSVPFVSDSSSEPLRIWVDLKNQTGTSIDEAEFTVHIADYRFNATAAKDLHSSQYSNNTSSKDVKHSGYYQIDVPQSYSTSQGKIVFSFNAEYCRALLRHRCGDPSQTAHGSANYILDSSVDNGSGSVNANSIFPIGKRPYTEMGGGFRNTRKEWYAPRIQICRDLSFVPATFVSVTDLGLEMNAESMVIQDVKWGASSSDVDELVLTLERDESLSSQRLIDYIFNKDNDGLQQGSGGSGNNHNPEQGGNTPVKPPVNDPTVDLDPDVDQSLGDSYDDLQDGSFELDDGMTVGKMSRKTYGNLKGRMSLPNDNLSGGATFSVLGQQKPAVVPSTMRGIEGMDVDVSIVGGTASRTADGFIFAGKGLTAADEIIESQEVSLETSFVVPNDILSNRMSIQATSTHSPLSASGKTCAVLYVTVSNENAGVTVTNEVKVYTGTSNKIIDILPEQTISGLRKSNNRILVRITRKPGTGSDTADATSVILKNLSVKMQRASANTGSSADKFSASRT